MDNERLRQLREQKALIESHLDWINQQIDRETLHDAPSPSPKLSRLKDAILADRPIADSLGLEDPESTSQEQVASDLYSQLGPDTRSAAADTKRGCLLFAGLAFSLLAGAIAYIIFFY